MREKVISFFYKEFVRDRKSDEPYARKFLRSEEGQKLMAGRGFTWQSDMGEYLDKVSLPFYLKNLRRWMKVYGS
jgi:hypothetical protein